MCHENICNATIDFFPRNIIVLEAAMLHLEIKMAMGFS